MGIKEFFSARSAKIAKPNKPDVYIYDDLPNPFRVQVVHIWQRAMANFLVPNGSYGKAPPFLSEIIEQQIAEAHGLFRLGDERDAFHRLANYFLNVKDPVKALDIIEAVFNAIDDYIRRAPGGPNTRLVQHPDEAIADLNHRFLQYTIGYQYAGGHIVRIDSQYLHASTVKPALSLLSERGFAGPQDEFLRAHEHYREHRYKESINEALKALESTLKVICDQQGWEYDRSRDTASKLLALVMDKELVPSFLQNAFSGIRSVLESAVPTTRNRTSGHGQGAVPLVVPDYFAAYALHSTAASIVFLVEAHKSSSRGRR